MDEPGVAAALLREHLPAEVAALLAPDAPELLDAHFVAAHLRHSQADRLYKARALGGGEVYIYVLLEHKSAPDPEVGVQLLGYLAEIWRRLDRQRLERGGAVGSDRPPIVPLVIYHGGREWAVPLSFGETVAADPALRRYLPDFTYALLDLGQVPERAAVQPACRARWAASAEVQLPAGRARCRRAGGGRRSDGERISAQCVPIYQLGV